jgi:recombinational DNA repair ATPase RecF
VRIQTIAAKGLMSFQDFRLPLDPSITVIVGPNGSGKSNVFQLLELMIRGLELAEDATNDARFAMDAALEARFCGEMDGPAQIVTDVALTKPAEKHLITSFLQSSVYTALVGQWSGQGHDAIADWTMTAVTDASLQPL